MKTAIDLLEQRVSLVIARLAGLRADVARLERELLASPAAQEPSPPAMDGNADRLAEENARLLAERSAVLDRVREIIAEIDRAL